MDHLPKRGGRQKRFTSSLLRACFLALGRSLGNRSERGGGTSTSFPPAHLQRGVGNAYRPQKNLQ